MELCSNNLLNHPSTYHYLLHKDSMSMGNRCSTDQTLVYNHLMVEEVAVEVEEVAVVAEEEEYKHSKKDRLDNQTVSKMCCNQYHYQ